MNDLSGNSFRPEFHKGDSQRSELSSLSDDQKEIVLNTSSLGVDDSATDASIRSSFGSDSPRRKRMGRQSHTPLSIAYHGESTLYMLFMLTIEIQ